jgi:DNA polymerase-3 subunit alpha
MDSENNGLYRYNKNNETSTHLVQIAWEVYAISGKFIEKKCYIIKPEGYDIPYNSYKIHGITNNIAIQEGISFKEVFKNLKKSLSKVQIIVGHNIKFDINIIKLECLRRGYDNPFINKIVIDTKYESINYCAIPGGLKGKFKLPTLTQLYTKIFGKRFTNVHDAYYDVEATAHCFFALIKLGVISNKIYINNIDTYTIKKQHTPPKIKLEKNQLYRIIKLNKLYSHLHNHTNFSLLSSTIQIHSLVETAFQMNMSTIGIIDYGNLMGSYYFLQKIEYYNQKIAIINDKIKKYGGMTRPFMKGVIGCEFFISENKDCQVYHQVLLAKNKQGYHNLSQICYEGYILGNEYPIVGKDILVKYKSNLIALTGDLHSEIPYTIINKGEFQAEALFKWWHKCFGNDFYVELIRQGLEGEHIVNKTLIKFAKKYNVKYIPQNNNFYLNKINYNTHDIILCIKNKEKKSTPIGKGKGYRFGLLNKEFNFSNKYIMAIKFYDLPESFDNLKSLIQTIVPYSLHNNKLLPKFNITDNITFTNVKIKTNKISENSYLRYLTYKGAKEIYGNINEKIKKRLNFELETIKKTCYPGYFLIVHDFVKKAKEMNISVGPGRGSVAGSLVAYCLGITNIDPIKHNLLFERFLNKDRVSSPDIDIDFDSIERDNIIKWIVNKYGYKKVAKIITFGYMGAKSSIRDTARVMDLALDKADSLSKMTHNLSLKRILGINKSDNRIHYLDDAIQLKKIYTTNSLEGKVLNKALLLEGSLRNTGVHACGIIITPSDINKYIPVAGSKKTNLLLTQFDINIIEYTGLLKMDILGLKTLTIIKDSISLINKIHNLNLDPKNLPLDDNATYNLFKKGKTIAVFQYESVGMQKYLRNLKPENLNDLIAMNALYRPGPLKYIKNFIARKKGKEAITYDLPIMKNILKTTYGITVYQEQVMLLSQKIANFGKGEADMLRQAIGKKQKNVIDKMKHFFLLGALNNGYDKKNILKIWNDWESFASYAFNKSHSTCYAYLAFQNAYLKTHYPKEFMSTVLSNNMHDINNQILYMKECSKIGINLLGPDINISDFNYTLENNSIRFGLCAIKGIGKSVVDIIINERKQNGMYKSILDFIKRVNLSVVNKKAIKILILAGVFDSFNVHRSQYFGLITIEKIRKFCIKYKKKIELFTT